MFEETSYYLKLKQIMSKKSNLITSVETLVDRLNIVQIFRSEDGINNNNNNNNTNEENRVNVNKKKQQNYTGVQNFARLPET